jgi:uncharacterized protein
MLHAQTNATLLDEVFLDEFLEHDIKVGVSLDGNPLTHDANRYRPGGGGSYADVASGLRLLGTARYRHLFAGLLCVIDHRSDPVMTYEHLLAHEPPVIDFLLPHANWSNPPRRAPDDPPEPYADWLIEIFDHWYSAPRRATSIRLFEEIIRGILGQPSRTETVGLSPATHIVVETDGTIEQADALKSTYHGAASTGLHVWDDPFDAALLEPHVIAQQIGAEALAPTCRGCEVRDVCGGGHYPHRYHRGSGFRNPSVYCADLAALIRHVRDRVRRDLVPIRTPAAG